MCDTTHRFKGVVFDDCTAAAGLAAQVKFLKSRSLLNLLFQMTIKLTFEKFSLYDSSMTDSTGQISQKVSFTVISHGKLITIRLFENWSYFSKVCLLLNGLREMTVDLTFRNLSCAWKCRDWRYRLIFFSKISSLLNVFCEMTIGLFKMLYSFYMGQRTSWLLGILILPCKMTVEQTFEDFSSLNNEYHVKWL